MTIIGIDVSKDKIDCLWIRDLDKLKIKTKVYKNNPRDHKLLIAWAQQNTKEDIEQIHFVMEATSIYHEMLAYNLHKAGAKVSVINPAQIRNYAKSLGTRTKTDKKDSMVIARFGLAHNPRLWEPEPEEIRRLKALLARYEAIKADIQRELNRLEKAQANQAHQEVHTSINTIVKSLNEEKARLEELINQHIDQNPDLKQDKKLLESIPGVGPVVSQQMSAIIRSRSFNSAQQCAAFLGLIPVSRESGTSLKARPHLSKSGNASVRAKLYMAAISAIKYNPDIKQQYERLIKRGKSKMSALCAAMRKLVHICFGVLKHQQPYQQQTP